MHTSLTRRENFSPEGLGEGKNNIEKNISYPLIPAFSATAPTSPKAPTFGALITYIHVGIPLEKGQILSGSESYKLMCID